MVAQPRGLPVISGGSIVFSCFRCFLPSGVYAPTITAFKKNEDVTLAGTRAFVRSRAPGCTRALLTEGL
jgi:hypothetical protein